MIEEMSNHIKVWDILVRVFHWSLVLFFVMAYVTEGDLIGIHSYAGYTLFFLVLCRLVWGLIGPTYARFSSFVTSPKKALKYLKDEVSGDAKHYLGHNPAGGLMVIALIISLLATVITGASIIATEGSGPLAMTFVASFSGELLEEIHEFFTTIVLLLVILHIGGVIFSSFLQEENLIKAMFTGKKKIKLIDRT